MKCLMSWIEKNKEKVWFSFLMNLAVFLMMMLMMHPQFETNDDVSIEILVNGAFGVYEPRTMCQHYLLGVFHSFLYSVLGTGVPWYALVQHIVLLISFTVIIHIVFRKCKIIPAFCISGLIWIYFGYECYIAMQYTKTSGVATAAAVFLLFYSVTKEKISYKGLLGALLLGGVGYLYRYNEYAVVLALMTGIGVFLLLDIKSFPKQERIKRVLTGIAVYVLMAVMGVGLFAMDVHMYRVDPEWSYYWDYNNLRAAVMDYEFPPYEGNEEAFEGLGIDETAHKLYYGWNFNDPDKVTSETWEGIVALQTEKPPILTAVRAYLGKFPWGFFDTSVFYCALLLLVCWIFLGKHDYRTVLTVLYEAAIFMLAYFYLYYSGRYLKNHVDTGLWMAFSLVMIWLLPLKDIRISKKAWGIFFLTILLINQRTWSSKWRIVIGDHRAGCVRGQEIFEEIAQDKEHLYLAMEGILQSKSYEPYDIMEEGLMENIVWLGGWETNMACVNEKMERYGVSNPFRDAVDNEKVYIVDNYMDTVLKYIRKYYNENAQAELVREINGKKIYRIISQ